MAIYVVHSTHAKQNPWPAGIVTVAPLKSQRRMTLPEKQPIAGSLPAYHCDGSLVWHASPCTVMRRHRLGIRGLMFDVAREISRVLQ